MAKEFVLDIGIGSGGEYINNNIAPNERRVGVDLVSSRIYFIPDDYPDVLPVFASGEFLPFKQNTFARIEIILPFDTLARPGLQKDHFTLSEEYKVLYANRYPHGWYEEFQRVLKPSGNLMIYGDIWVDPKQVQETSERLFEVEQITKLSIEDIRALKTRTAETVISNIEQYPVFNGKKIGELLTKINLRSTKTN